MTPPEAARVEEIRQRRARHRDVLDEGGTELALIGEDIDWLLARLQAWEAYESETWRGIAEAAEAEAQRLREGFDILAAANERHADPRCGHCAYALTAARAALAPSARR